MNKTILVIGIILFSIFAGKAQNHVILQRSYIDQDEIVFEGDVTSDHRFNKYLDYLDKSKIVAMGESTHGTHEFQSTKISSFKYLVHKGFNVFALEANYSECEAINRFIADGIGNPHQLIGKLQLWPWKTDEMLGLVKWMRKYNVEAHNTKKLEFFGFDSGNGIFLGVPSLKKLLGKYNFPDQLQQVEQLEKFQITNKTERDSISKGFNEIKTRFIKTKRTTATRIGAYQYNVIINTLNSIIQNYEYYFINFVYLVRDRHMADNIANLFKEKPNDKVFVFAHNAHVTFNSSYYEQYGKDSVLILTKTMGYYLKQQFKQNYQAIGLDFLAGRFRVNYFDPGLKNRVDTIVNLGPAPLTYIAATLLKNPEANAGLLINNRCKTLPDSIILHNNGGAKPKAERSFEKNSFIYGFDGLLIFRKTTPTKILLADK